MRTKKAVSKTIKLSRKTPIWWMVIMISTIETYRGLPPPKVKDEDQKTRTEMVCISHLAKDHEIESAARFFAFKA